MFGNLGFPKLHGNIAGNVRQPLLGRGTVRKFLTLGGVNEDASSGAYTAVDGDIIEFDYSSTATATQTILDESTGLNRLFCTLTTSGTTFSVPTGVTVDVDGGGNTVAADGKLHHVTLTIGAAAAGLVIDTYFRKFDSTEFFTGVVANIKFTGSDNRLYRMQSGSLTTEPNALNPGVNDLTLNNLIASDWETMTQIGADWLGSELVVNGGFDTGDLSQWTTGNASLAVVGGELEATTSSTIHNVKPEINVTHPSVYRFKWAALTTTQAELKYSAFNLTAVEEYVPPTLYSLGGNSVDVIVTSPGVVGFYVLRDSGSAGVSTFDNVSVRRILEAP